MKIYIKYVSCILILLYDDMFIVLSRGVSEGLDQPEP